jgi:hypothetical protein
VNWSALPVADVPPVGVVTVMSTVPAEPDGLMAVISESLTKLYEVAAVLPKWTAVTPVKAEPMMSTEVPPLSGPSDGSTSVTDVAGS